MPGKLRGFWLRISDGIAIHQLWEQFQADARAGYHLVSKGLGSKGIEGESRRKRGWRVARGLFWAVMMRLSPGRRVLLVVRPSARGEVPGVDISSAARLQPTPGDYNDAFLRPDKHFADHSRRRGGQERSRCIVDRDTAGEPTKPGVSVRLAH